MTLVHGSSYKDAQRGITYFASVVSVLAIISAGTIAYGYDQADAIKFVAETFFWYPLVVLFEVIEMSFLFRLNGLIKATKHNIGKPPEEVRTEMDLNLTLGDSYLNYYILMLFYGFAIFFVITLFHFRQQGVIRKCCRRVSIPCLTNEET